MLAYYEHNKNSKGNLIIERLLKGENCALVSDAGMPAISDPGEDIVRLCAEANIKVSVIPGASAAVSALALSGLATGRFAFEGFLSAKDSERRKKLETLKSEERTVIFYEAPHKLKATLSDMEKIFGGERRISLCRELTKLNEEIIRTTLSGAVALYTEKEPRGEYVLVVEGTVEAGCVVSGGNNPLLSLSPREHVEHYIASGMAKMDAIKAVAKERGVPKSVIYNEMI